MIDWNNVDTRIRDWFGTSTEENPTTDCGCTLDECVALIPFGQELEELGYITTQGDSRWRQMDAETAAFEFCIYERNQSWYESTLDKITRDIYPDTLLTRETWNAMFDLVNRYAGDAPYDLSKEDLYLLAKRLVTLKLLTTIGDAGNTMLQNFCERCMHETTYISMIKDAVLLMSIVKE